MPSSSSIRRETFFSRDCTLTDALGLVASTRQEWAVVSYGLERIRAPRSLLDAFPVEPGDEITMPETTARSPLVLPPPSHQGGRGRCHS